ncbi:hypothetical protein EV193_103298 [Herbihabitans rhizosphaerae]|uniref:Uncharacterized protein n=1 Tax=Herbihabitans rhizosphaerae TaxID=1872711 RepID=A0A4Q7KXE5_9PSEU|nr:hypothetical protein [Herbihabitans rhizosphaerae]RZS40980.1 hypothetical protein EV193_103298 [Herbihabitans rhizosphaerae]
MTQENDIRTALRELEAERPGVDAVRTGVHKGIERRARRRRTAVVAGSALTVAALAAGAVVLTTDREPSQRHAAPPTVTSTAGPGSAELAGVTVPASIFPLDPGDTGKGLRRNVFAGPGKLQLVYSGNPNGFMLTITPKRPDVRGLSVQPATIRERQATLATAANTPPRLMWQLGDGQWATVEATSADARAAERIRMTANGMVERPTRIESPVRVTLAPKGFFPSTMRREDPFGWDPNQGLWLCPPGGEGLDENSPKELAPCLSVTATPTKLLDSDRHAPPSSVSTSPGWPNVPPPGSTNTAKPPAPSAWGPLRKVDGAIVRLSQDGQSAAKVVDEERAIVVTVPSGQSISGDALLKIAASASVRS